MASDSSKVVLGVIVTLVVGLVAAAITLSVIGPETEYDPSTAAGVAQAFYEAIIDGDDQAALDLLEDDLAAECGTTRPDAVFPRSSSIRVTLVAVDVQGDTAVVTVDVTEVDDPSPFDVDGYTHRERLTMRSSSGTWRISESPWPYFCHEKS
jgi:hypothetical protein